MENRPLKGMKAFLSGPMTGHECYNLLEFVKAHKRLQSLGAAHIYDPALVWLNRMMRDEKEESHEFYMRETITELARDMSSQGLSVKKPFYDIMVLLDGWENSDGATTETYVANACGVEVVQLGRLDEWIERGMRDEQDHGCVGAPEGARQHHEHGGDRELRRD